MNDGSKIDEAIEKGITEESFYVPAHARIFRRLLECYNKGIAIELITIVEYFKDQELLDHIGGASNVSEIYTYQATSASYGHFLNTVLAKEKLRRIISECTASIAEAYDNPEDVDDFLDDTEKRIFSIGRSREAKDIVKSDSLIEKSIENLQRFIDGDEELMGLPTRFKMLNDLTGGLRDGEMFIVAARPSMGKTTLLCNFVEDLMASNIPGLVFTCEMTDQQFMDRILYGRAKFPMHYLKKGFTPSRGELQRIQGSIEDLVKKNLFIDDTSAIKIDELRSKARRKKKDEDIRYIGVDYLQLMRGSRKYEGREKEITEISSGLKALAKELRIPLIVLAQLNRGPEKRQEGLPRMSDLRESGAIEQDADTVGLLYRADYYKDDEEDESSDDSSKKQDNEPRRATKASLILDKNRNGPTGEVEMRFQKDIMQFT